MIEDEIEPAAASLEPEAEPGDITPPAKSPWKAFVLTGLLAGIIGAIGGGYGAYEGLKRLSPPPAPQSKVDLSPIELKLDQLVGRVAKAEKAARDVESNTAEATDLSAIEDRLGSLETAPNFEIEPEALAALQAAQADGFDWPDVSVLEARITALEKKTDGDARPAIPTDLMSRFSALETAFEDVQNSDSVIDEDMMSDLTTRISNLENQPAPQPVVKRVTLLAFPKLQLIEAVEDNQEGGMIEKALSRHIRVKDTNDPLTLIDGIESDLSEGQLGAAAKKFERLPTAVKPVGQAWYESVKASL